MTLCAAGLEVNDPLTTLDDDRKMKRSGRAPADSAPYGRPASAWTRRVAPVKRSDERGAALEELKVALFKVQSESLRPKTYHHDRAGGTIRSVGEGRTKPTLRRYDVPTTTDNGRNTSRII